MPLCGMVYYTRIRWPTEWEKGTTHLPGIMGAMRTAFVVAATLPWIGPQSPLLLFGHVLRCLVR